MYDVECVGDQGGSSTWVATDCIYSNVLLVSRDDRMKGGTAAVAFASEAAT